jgi:8-oxo-dGTP pyrophosphatase MutT (NUDIX family)
MKFEKSCGAIIFRKENNIIETLLIRMIGGHWSYPKGHVEKDETEVETALREIKEETNLEVIIDTRFREITTYSPKPDVLKDVIYFIGFAKTTNVLVQETEVSEYMWIDIKDAINYITIDEDKKIFKRALRFIEEISE